MPKSNSPHVVIVGSINMDLVATVPRLPERGQTVHGQELHEIPGGKGANQAVAVARLGGRASMVARVGDDGFGSVLLDALNRQGVSTAPMLVTPDCSSGVALIGVEESGENAITIISGANGRLTPRDVYANETLIAGADAVLLQLEIPLETVIAAVGLARKYGVLSVLDPAPVPSLSFPEDLYGVDVVSPNQSEAESLTGVRVRGVDDAVKASRLLRARGAGMIVVKLGAQGALLFGQDDQIEHVIAFDVEPVDTTAAGDAFTAALTLGLARGWAPCTCVRFACAAGALAATALGAQPAMPSLEDVNAMLSRGSD